MLKNNKIFPILFFLSFSLIAYIFVTAKKVDMKAVNSKSTSPKTSVKKINSSKEISEEKQEEEYVKNINKITKRYKIFIDSVNEKVQNSQSDTNHDFVIFSSDEKKNIDEINKDLRNILVPKKYKNFHLLLSRSLLKLSSYINTSNPKDVLLGLELFDQAEKEYTKLELG